MNVAYPRFKMPSCTTLACDCYLMNKNEENKKDYLKLVKELMWQQMPDHQVKESIICFLPFTSLIIDKDWKFHRVLF